jgi:tyrosine-protein phosphatase YwqE
LSIFNFFRTNTRLQVPVELSVLNCDIHSHFIPWIDDGSKTMEDSILMLSEMHKLGYKKVITTPHIMSDYFKNTPEIILDGLEKVRAALKLANVPIQIEAAAEYYLDFDFERKLTEEKILTFGDNYVLFEISYLNPPDNLFSIVFKMQTLGYKPVLAHPERYNYFHTDFKIYESFIEKGILLQLNINSLTGYYSDSTKKIAEQLIDKNMISFLGTDCHHEGHIELIKKALYEKHLLQLIKSGTLLNSTLI